MIRKKLDALDITWKIAFRKTLLVFGCYFGALTICFIIVMGLGIISFGLFPQEVSSTFFNDTTIRFFALIVPFFGCLIGLFKALIDILSLKEEDSSTFLIYIIYTRTLDSRIMRDDHGIKSAKAIDFGEFS